MNICSNYGVVNYGYNKPANNIKNKNISFAGYKGHKDTDWTPWGTTYGEERVSAERAAAHRRAVVRDVLKNSPDKWVRDCADDVGKDPAWDESLAQREFDRYHAEFMAQRNIEAAKLKANAGIKKYNDDGTYTIADEKGRVIERGKGDEWDTKYEYDIKYPVERFGEHYTIYGAVKETRPDDTYVIKVSQNSDNIVEEKLKNKSIEYIDNCTHNVKSIGLPDGTTFAVENRFLFPKQTKDSRQYYAQYDDKTVVLEVFNDGTYSK